MSKSKFLKTLIIFGLVNTVSGIALAQTCLSGAPQTSPTGLFSSVAEGEVQDAQTRLIWKQCAEGQTFLDDACIGEPTRMTWQQALQHAQKVANDERVGWRLPNVKELATITERQCVRPAINESVFPSTPSDDFWTATPSVDDPLRAWVVAFFNSSHSIKQKDRFIYVRLVRQ
jgi:hypothetical protein